MFRQDNCDNLIASNLIWKRLRQTSDLSPQVKERIAERRWVSQLNDKPTQLTSFSSIQLGMTNFGKIHQ